MVQFELKLEENVIAKWKDHYLSYEKLKRVLKELKSSKKDSKKKDKNDKKKKGKESEETTPTEKEELISDESTNKKRWFGATDHAPEPFMDFKNFEQFDEIDQPKTIFERALCFEVIKFCRFYEQTVNDLQDQFDRYAQDMTLSTLGINAFADAAAAAGHSNNQSVGPNKTKKNTTTSFVDHVDNTKKKKEYAVDDDIDGDIDEEDEDVKKKNVYKETRKTKTLKKRMKKLYEANDDDETEDESAGMFDHYVDDDLKKKSAERRSRHSKKKALSILYREMLELKNFAGLNYTAVIKIVKKANKTLKLDKEVKSAPSFQSLSTAPGTPDYLPISPEVFEVFSEDESHDRSMRRASRSSSLPRYDRSESEGELSSNMEAGGRDGDDLNRDLLELAIIWMDYLQFNQGAQVQHLLRDLEKLYSVLFCDGNIELAVGELESKSHSDKGAYSYEMLKLGFRMGMAMSFGVWMLWDCVIQGFKEGELGISSTPAFPVLSALAGFLTLHWSWGIQVWVWTRFRVNYEYVFEFDPRTTRSYFKIFNDCAIDTIVYFSCVLCYLKATVGRMPVSMHALGIKPGAFVILCLLYACYRMVHPWKERKGLWSTGYYLLFPWKGESVTFFQTYFGDVLTSMVKVLLNVNFTVYFLASGDIWRNPNDYFENPSPWKDSFFYVSFLGPAVVFLPLWFRFIQCLVRYKETGKRWPHQPNALKYGFAMVVTVFSALHPLYTTFSDTVAFQLFWISLFVISTLYSTYWDIWQDWGLGKLEYGLLNDRQMFPGRHYYYGAMVSDLVLRSAWVYTLVPPAAQATSGGLPTVMKITNWFAPIAMFLEMLRRTIWGVFRLENEQLRNTEGFRRVKFVPLHFDTAVQKLETTGQSVVLEVVGFGSFIVAVGACIVVVSANRYNDHQMLTDDAISSHHHQL